MTFKSSAASHTPPVEDKHRQLSKVFQEIERLLEGQILEPSATPVAEQVLCDQALRHYLVLAGRNLAHSLRELGLSVELKYCTSATHGHPLPFLITHRTDGSMVVPDLSPSDPHLHGSDVCVIDCEIHTGVRYHRITGNNSVKIPCNGDPLVLSRTGAIVLMPRGD